MDPVRKPSYDREDLLRCGRGELFGFDNARLPLPDMLMMDRITHISDGGGAGGKGLVLAELDIRPDLWFFACHFPGDPVMPGCLGLDGLWQLLGFFLGWGGYRGRGRALGVDELRFRGEIHPTAKVVGYRLDIRKVFTGKLKMAVADGTVSADGREIYFAKGLRVGLFDAGQPVGT